RDSSDNRQSYSDHGPTSVHLAAPGDNVLSTWLGTDPNADASYHRLSGTSGATPHVSGTAALLLGQNNSLTVAQLMSAILNNVDVLPQWFGVTVTGGRLNTYQALVNGSFNGSPAVPLPSPTNGAAFTAPATITITANAHDSDGSVARVDFYANGSLIGSAVASPFTFTWTKVAAGAYTLTAVATDNH